MIGSTGHQFVDCIEWGTDPLPNIVDYDIIVMNVRSLSDDFLKKVSSQQIEDFRKKLIRFLFSSGELIILSDYSRSVDRPKKYPDNYYIYSWCPIEINTVKESGTTIQIDNNRFPKYFSKFKKWNYYFHIPNECLTRELTDTFGATYNTKYELSKTILIKNRYERMLSGTVSIEVYYKQTKHPRIYGKPPSYYLDEPDQISGEITLLPFLEEMDSKNAVNLLLEDLIGKPQVPLPPSWTLKVKMPFTKELDKELENISKQITNLQSEFTKIEEEKRNIESYKKLIYSDGLDLEDIFKKCIKELGGEIIPKKYSEEEFGFVYKGRECLVEAKGISKSVSLTHLRQLLDYMLKYEEETSKKCKGVLFGNPWKNKSLQERNAEKRPNFPPNVIDRATKNDISLVSSVDFFKIFCKFLEGKIEGQKVLETIINTKGLVIFK